MKSIRKMIIEFKAARIVKNVVRELNKMEELCLSMYRHGELGYEEVEAIMHMINDARNQYHELTMTY